MPNSVAHNLIVQHRIGLERYGVALNKKILSKLNKAEADIVAKLAAMPELEAGTYGPSTATKQHLEATLSQIRSTAVEAMAVVNSTIETELGDLAVHEVEWASGTYKASLPFATNFATPAPQLLKAIVTTRPLQGRYIKDWLLQYPDQIKQKVHDAVMLGVMEGESTSQIVQRIRGTRALNYGDAVLKGTKNGIEALTRTAVNHVTTAAHHAFLEDNLDVFDRYQLIAVLDQRTTPVCRARSGRVYEIGKGPIPPFHVRCRTTIAPVVIGEEVKPINDYAKWLADQPVEVQKDVLGPTKHKLWMDGRVPIDKFVADTGRPLTLEQLKKADAVAWSKAFGAKSPADAIKAPGTPEHKTPPEPVQIVAKSSQKTIAAAKVQIAENAEAVAAKKAAEAEVAKVLALETAAQRAKEAAQAKKAAALTRIEMEAENGSVSLSQKASSPTEGASAKKYAGNSAEIAKASGEIAQVALSDIEIVYSGNLTADAVKAVIEKFDPDFPVYAAKIGDKYHLIEGKSALKAAEALKEPAIKVKFIDATKAVAEAEAAAAETAMLAKEKAAADAKIAKALAAAKAAGKKLKLTDQEIMTVKHEVAQGNTGKTFYKLKTADHEYYDWAGLHFDDVNTVERAAIDYYKGSGYRSINEALRRANGDRAAIKQAGGEVANRIARMDRAMARNELPVDVLTMRGFDIRHSVGLGRGAARLPAGFKPEDLIGKTVGDHGYMSFSVREAAPANFATGSEIANEAGESVAFIMSTVSKKGTPALRGTHYEQEIIRRGGDFRVVNIREETQTFRAASGSSYSKTRFYVLDVEEIE